MQIGANDGQRSDPIFQLVKRHRLRGLAVEPLSDMFAALRKTYATEPQVRLVNVAVHRTDMEITLYRVRPEANVPDWAHGIASLNPKHHEKSGTAAEHMISERVPATTLEYLLDSHEISNIDLFIVDTEGYDSEIISMLLDGPHRPSMISFEHGIPYGTMSLETFCMLSRRLMEQGYFLLTLEEDTVAYRLDRCS